MPAPVIKAPPRRPTNTLGKALEVTHQRWLDDLRAALAPALLAGGTRWDRWTAVRDLQERFTPRLEQERELLRRIPRFDETLLAPIETGYQELERLARQIDLAGRRRHTGGLVMLLLKDLLQRVTDWCATVEHAVATVPLTTLPREAVSLLADLQ